MTGTVAYDGKSKPSATEGAVGFEEPRYPARVEELHVAHELVAIGNDADYCLCGNTWPCEKRSE